MTHRNYDAPYPHRTEDRGEFGRQERFSSHRNHESESRGHHDWPGREGEKRESRHGAERGHSSHNALSNHMGQGGRGYYDYPENEQHSYAGREAQDPEERRYSDTSGWDDKGYGSRNPEYAQEGHGWSHHGFPGNRPDNSSEADELTRHAGTQSRHPRHDKRDEEDAFDPEYRQWRAEQIKKLDEDYKRWKQERYTKFSEEFDAWRRNQPATSPAQHAVAPPPAPESRHRPASQLQRPPEGDITNVVSSDSGAQDMSPMDPETDWGPSEERHEANPKT